MATDTPLTDPAMERRRQACLKQLANNPEISRAWVADGQAEPVPVHIAIRGVASCELVIAADRWDEFALLDLMENL